MSLDLREHIQDEVPSCGVWSEGGRTAANDSCGGSIECVAEFSYLGSLIAANGRIDVEVDKRIACASKVFGALRLSVFKNTKLFVTTKRRVYQACVLSVLLYGGECWIRHHLKQMNTFHHHFICTMPSITNRQNGMPQQAPGSSGEMWRPSQ